MVRATRETSKKRTGSGYVLWNYGMYCGTMVCTVEPWYARAGPSGRCIGGFVVLGLSVVLRRGVVGQKIHALRLDDSIDSGVWNSVLVSLFAMIMNGSVKYTDRHRANIQPQKAEWTTTKFCNLLQYTSRII